MKKTLAIIASLMIASCNATEKPKRFPVSIRYAYRTAEYVPKFLQHVETRANRECERNPNAQKYLDIANNPYGLSWTEEDVKRFNKWGRKIVRKALVSTVKEVFSLDKNLNLGFKWGYQGAENKNGLSFNLDESGANLEGKWDLSDVFRGSVTKTDAD